MYEGLETVSQQANFDTPQQLEAKIQEPRTNFGAVKAFQLRNKYIFTSIKSGAIIINQTRAHQRVLYDRLTEELENGQGSSQQLLFPGFPFV